MSNRISEFVALVGHLRQLSSLLGSILSNPLAFSQTVCLYLRYINDTLFIIFLALEVIHDHSHTRHNACDIMPSGAIQ